MAKLSQSKKIEALERQIEVMVKRIEELEKANITLLGDNQNLQNLLRVANNTCEEQLQIIKSLPDLNKYCELKHFDSKVRT